MIFIDTETTGLLSASATDLESQPHITEICIVKTSDDLSEVIEEYEQLVNPGIPIPEFIVKAIGITDDMVRDMPTFPQIYTKVADLFLGEKKVVAHNCTFDMGMLWCELSRMECEHKFPWPMEWICTVEKSFHLQNKRLKLGDLHMMATGQEHKEKAHRAKEDVYAMIRAFAWLKKGGHI